MQVSKKQVVNFIRARGDEDRAVEAESGLPDSLDLAGDEPDNG